GHSPLCTSWLAFPVFLARISPPVPSMRYRAFDDYVGRRWEVWQTNPPRSDRRSTERRSDSDRRRETRASAPERRSDDRCNSDDRRNQSLRFPGIPQLEAGWLCFESDGVRKRLAP